ncbi:hypothetical protein KP509_27G056300 [Ceratopteris richardii]|uniref:Plant heme peroxidase family profile domain-containing protein n=1 Tax=Ceratopteris richardii TaxID=49495 RepID=A0A8T2RGH7_CERRI|nr:hypothetical protein KP509_27G056300 [Ceratopteris richardii]
MMHNSAGAGIVLLLTLFAPFSIGICPQLPVDNTSTASLPTSPFRSNTLPLLNGSNSLSEDLYDLTCARALTILNETLLLLAFHDRFVQGCGGSVLLSPELQDGQNRNSLRGLEAIDEATRALEQECPGLMSCADIIQLAARHAVVQSGGPFYPLAMGRRDGFIMNGSLGCTGKKGRLHHERIVGQR